MHLDESTCRSWSSDAGSNLLVADGGFDGLVVALGPGFDTLEVGRPTWSGPERPLSLPVLARRTAAAGLTGLEWAVGVPGSVGGAIRMNAGGHGSDTAATLVGFRWVDLATGSADDSSADRLGPGYRQTALSADRGGGVRDVPARAGRPDQGAATIAEIVRWRRANQPGGSNAGSVFVNPPGDSAGRLIDACGPEGLPDRHGRGLRPSTPTSSRPTRAVSADDVLSADRARAGRRWPRSTGTDLRTEVRLVGFPGPGERP